MDTLTAFFEHLDAMLFIFWKMKYWVAALAAVMLVLWYYSPASEYIPARVQEDDRP